MELDIIGKEIGSLFNKIFDLVEDSGLTEEDIKLFENYLDTQEAAGPLFNPGVFHDGFMFDAISLLKKRMGIIRGLFEHKEDSGQVVAKRLESKANQSNIQSLEELMG